jgi:TRAP-type C4-dicarboxylate transport system permease small subunit
MSVKLLGKIDKSLEFLEGWTLFLAVVIALIVAATNITMRKLTPYSLYWSDEVVRKSMYITTYIGCSLAIRNRSQIRIDALAQLLPFTKWPLTVISHFSMVVFGVLMVWLGGTLTYEMYQDPYALTTGLQIPEWYFYAVLPLLGLLSIVRTGMVMGSDWRDRRGSSS